MLKVAVSSSEILANILSIDASYDDLLLHNNVRWLNKGRVLQRFWAIKKELHTFRKGQNSVKAKLFWHFLEDDVKMETTGFLSGIMLHLNDLNPLLARGSIWIHQIQD